MTGFSLKERLFILNEEKMFMTIIPYINSGCLDSNTLRHFNTIREAVEWAFDDMYTQPDNTDTIQKRFRIILS